MPDDLKALSREDVCLLIMKTPLWNGAEWHWFGFHFTILLDPCAEHPFARAIIDALVVCDAAMPGYAEAFIERLASVRGKEKFTPHYEQRCASEHGVSREWARRLRREFNVEFDEKLRFRSHHFSRLK